MKSPPVWLRTSPALFVFLWSTGFIGATYGLPYAEPWTFLAYRFAIVVVLLAGFSVITGAPWPSTPKACLQNAFVGVLIHGIYLGGVFAAISRGMPTGLAALVIGLQPALTAIAARPVLGERVSRLQWLGILLGFSGLVLVVGNKAVSGGTTGWQPDGPALALNLAALLAITAGSIYQKAYLPHQNIRTGTTWQYVGGFAVVFAVALMIEDGRVEWTGDFIFAMSWLVIVLSLGAVSLLMLIIRHGDVSRIASLFYLVPPVTAVLAYFLFGETLNAVQIAGMAVTTFGVALVNRRATAGDKEK
ncbi:MAG: DMT family transporter [Hyphomicrobiales bacterium]